MTPARIDPMNEYMSNTSAQHGMKVLWSHSLMTRENDFAYDESGLHVVENVAARKVDVVLNMRCNAELTMKRGFPFNKTSCSAYEHRHMIQASLLVFSLVMSFLGWGARSFYVGPYKGPTPNLIHACMKLGLALAYCFLADRTQVFSKVQKQFTYPDFFILCAIVLVLGFASIGRSKTRSSASDTTSEDPVVIKPFLSRDQTDEWKGWMQFAILIYHYTGASKVLWIYKIIRILVASYLFMTGYGNTIFFYQKSDYSSKRYAKVMLQYNLLSCLLPYMMDTHYLFYYFAPLVSFWYLVVYLTMRIHHDANTRLPVLLAKIAVSSFLVTSLVKWTPFFEGLFWLLEHTCRIKWDVREWKFRVGLDLYIVYAGMLAAILCSKISLIVNSHHVPAEAESPLISFIRRQWSKIRIYSIIAASILLPAFWAFAYQFTTKADYNKWVPYISVVPIGCFIILRNSTDYLRGTYSKLFAWLGRYSLETFTLQFHIWLAADTNGLLSLGLRGRKFALLGSKYLDLTLLSVIFLWMSWLVAGATVKITHWIIEPEDCERFMQEDQTPVLPVVFVSDIRLSEAAVRNRGPKGIWRRAAAAVEIFWKKSLEIRLALILLLMWILNIVWL
ncbi:MAG: hypothetical protein Q9174_006613 [Haloplaca sp. 1 TL-2023]